MKISKTWILLGLTSLIAQSTDSGTGNTGGNAVGQATDGSNSSGSTNSGNNGGTNSGNGSGGTTGNGNGTNGGNSSGNNSGNGNQSDNSGNSSGNNPNGGNSGGDSNNADNTGNNPNSGSSNNDKSGNNSNSGDSNSKDGTKNDSKNDSKNDKKSTNPNDTLSPLIRITEPIYLETAKKASISINRAAMFKWEYEGKKVAQPGSLTMTLEEDRGYKVAYKIAEDISGSDKKYLWDIPSYRPSNNESESIVLKPGGIYKMYIHDSNMKYNTLYAKGAYKPGVREFQLFASSDPSNPFGASTPTASLSLPLSLLVSLLSVTALYL